LAGNPGNALFTIDSKDARIDPAGDENTSREMLDGASLVMWAVVFTKQAQKDSKRLAASGLKPKAERLLKLLELNPLQSPPPYEKLVGDLAGAYSRRINIQHRLVYQILKEERIVKVIRMWTHYE
jgi:Txe/YoeB family toxin of toxin-antitoxin system